MQTYHYSHRITDARDEFFPAFWEIYDESFPIEEKRVLQDFGDELKDPLCHCLVYPSADGNGLDAILCYWEFSECRYVEYFAISSKKRHSGIGSELLSAFIGEDASKPVVLEIEPLSNEKNVRRWHFYERLGFVMNDFEHEYPLYSYDGIGELAEHVVVLSHGRRLSAEECNCFISDTEAAEERYSHSLCKKN